MKLGQYREKKRKVVHVGPPPGLTLANVMEFTEEARVICRPVPPNVVSYANKSWTMLTGFEQHEIEGRTLTVLQGPLTNKEAIAEMMHNVRITGYGCAEVVNYKKNGHPYSCKINIQPVVSLDDEGEYYITHLVGMIEPIIIPLPTSHAHSALPEFAMPYSSINYSNPTGQNQPQHLSMSMVAEVAGMQHLYRQQQHQHQQFNEQKQQFHLDLNQLPEEQQDGYRWMIDEAARGGLSGQNSVKSATKSVQEESIRSQNDGSKASEVNSNSDAAASLKIIQKSSRATRNSLGNRDGLPTPSATVTASGVFHNEENVQRSDNNNNSTSTNNNNNGGNNPPGPVSISCTAATSTCSHTYTGTTSANSAVAVSSIGDAPLSSFNGATTACSTGNDSSSSSDDNNSVSTSMLLAAVLTATSYADAPLVASNTSTLGMGSDTFGSNEGNELPVAPCSSTTGSGSTSHVASSNTGSMNTGTGTGTSTNTGTYTCTTGASVGPPSVSISAGSTSTGRTTGGDSPMNEIGRSSDNIMSAAISADLSVTTYEQCKSDGMAATLSLPAVGSGSLTNTAAVSRPQQQQNEEEEEEEEEEVYPKNKRSRRNTDVSSL